MARAGEADAKFEEEFAEAEARSLEQAKRGLQAHTASFDPETCRINVTLRNGFSFALEARRIPELQDASVADLGEMQLHPFGEGLSWPRLNVDLSVAGLIADFSGVRLWLREETDGGESSHGS